MLKSVERRSDIQVDVKFAVDCDGRTFMRRQRASYPFHVCRPHYLDVELPGLASLYLQSCSGGLYEGDSIDLRISAGPGGQALVSTQSSTVVHSMPRDVARQHVGLEAEEGSYLEYLPDPQILFPGSRLRSTVHACLTDNATVLVSDAFLVHDPFGTNRSFSEYTGEIVLATADGRTLAVDRIRIEGSQFDEGRPGVNGRFRAQGTLVVAHRGGIPPSLSELVKRVQAELGDGLLAFSLLPNAAGAIVRILATDGVSLRTAMHRCWACARLALKGSTPVERRK